MSMKLIDAEERKLVWNGLYFVKQNIHILNGIWAFFKSFYYTV